MAVEQGLLFAAVPSPPRMVMSTCRLDEYKQNERIFFKQLSVECYKSKQLLKFQAECSMRATVIKVNNMLSASAGATGGLYPIHTLAPEQRPTYINGHCGAVG